MRASNPELFDRSTTTASGGGETTTVATVAEGAEAAESMGPLPPPQPKSCTLTGSGINWAIYHGNVLSGILLGNGVGKPIECSCNTG